MPVLSETKQLLPVRLKLVSVIRSSSRIRLKPMVFWRTLPIPRSVELRPELRVLSASRSVELPVSRARSASRSVVSVAAVAAVAAFFSPLSNELYVPALLYQRHLNFAVRVVAPALRGTMLKFSEASRTAGPKPSRSIVRIAISFHRMPLYALQLTQKSLAVQCRKICDGRSIPHVPF